ncbi:MAG: enoyl-CoA hydratase [Pseudomonadota bacterium]
MTETTPPPVLISHPTENIAVVTLNRLKSRNALSREMMAELEAAITTLSYQKTVSAIVLAAEGPAFCAGHDLKELTAHRDDSDGGKAFYAETMRACSALMMAIVNCPKPVIASVHATATAAGCQLVATCDLAVADASAKFCTPGVNIGLFCSTPMVALSRNVSRKKAMEMLLLGDLISATDAETYGLVNRVVPDGEAMDGALAFAKTIASKSTMTVAYGKQAFYAQLEKPLADAYNFASDVMVQNMMATDAQEGIGAFLEKRPPVWKRC